MSFETVIPQRATIGESPCWVAEERSLYWMDIKQPALHRLAIDSGERHSWTLTSDIGGYAFMEDGGVLVALRRGLHRLDRRSGDLDLVAPPPFDPDKFRFNEGACDAAGRFWIGVMYDPIDGSGGCEKADLHSFTLDGGLRSEGEPSALHNGMAWTGDGKTFYLSHSYERKIIAFDYEVEGGRISNRRAFASLPDDDEGIPDGSSLDIEGRYWCADHGGGRLRVFRPDGSIERDIPLPMSQPTMCVFGGEELNALYITSASDGMSEADLAREPLAGAMLRFDPGTRGIARNFTVR